MQDVLWMNVHRVIPGEVVVSIAMGSSLISRVFTKRDRAIPTTFVLTLLSFAFMIIPVETFAGKSGGGNTPPTGTQLLPVRLGLPSGCGSSEGYALNNGSFPGTLVVAGMANCRGAPNTPYTWRSGSWQAVSTSASGIATDVSDVSTHSTEPTIVGFFAGKAEGGFVQSPGTAVKILPLLAGMDYFFYSARVSDRGGHIVGGNSDSNGHATAAVRWSLSGANWSPESLGSGAATAVSDDGTVVTGFGPEGAWIWLAGAGARSSLGTDAFPADIGFRQTSPTLSDAMIVGHRLQPCPDPCGSYEVPVYWSLVNGQWKRTDLTALEGMDSEALGVAAFNGRFVIVGYGYTKRDGIQRAVAWQQSSNGSFGAPLRLEAIDGRSKAWARAVDVNRNGLVLGRSSNGGAGAEAVLWQLP
jgi:hypothetical protein